MTFGYTQQKRSIQWVDSRESKGFLQVFLQQAGSEKWLVQIAAGSMSGTSKISGMIEI